MKIIFSMLNLFCVMSFAKGADTTATYIVPTSPELVPYSRFEVEIVKPYTGETSSEISYIFPKELTGDPALQVNFKLIEMDEDSKVSRWDAKEMTAVCTDNGEDVKCNMYLKKSPSIIQQSRMFQFANFDLSQFRATPILDSTKAVDFIKKSGFSKDVMDAKLSVLDKFLSSEPAGILSYSYN
ncbi:hypothetical protein K2X05_11515 [bacterium]|nr:hypothetical protein [bacterium]